jgi:hypothetical protein
LRDAAVRKGAGWAVSEPEPFGATVGSPEMMECATLANQYPPVLWNSIPRGTL